MEVSELPQTASVPTDVKDFRQFMIDCTTFIIGVMYSRKPHLPGGEYGIHVSISKSYFDQAMPVRADDVDRVKNVLAEKGCEWPCHSTTITFANGPFVGKGLHVWERKPFSEPPPNPPRGPRPRGWA